MIGRVGDPGENGGWPPHVHVQVLTALAGLPTITTPVAAPGVAPRSELALWQSVSPDPQPAARAARGACAPTRACPPPRSPGAGAPCSHRRCPSATASRCTSCGRGRPPVDADGRRWLDLVNNVGHVGHAHPRVVTAAAGQDALLDTNTRYLHEAVAEYARRLTETLPDPLSVCFFVNSGSEANDLALRLAYAHTRARDVLVLDHAYHGHLVSLIDVSPYKFDGPGGPAGPRRRTSCRCRTRTGAVRTPPDAARRARPRLLDQVDGLLDALAAPGGAAAAFLSEPMPGTAGQVVLARGLPRRRLRAGPGRGRGVHRRRGPDRGRPAGRAMWGFELHGVVPDVVTMGKPLGNGHPLGAVVTTPEVAASFLTGMEYFNTFGGNPVSARVGLAVLDVVADERLQAVGRSSGRGCSPGCARSAPVTNWSGTCAGEGLFVGVELVADRELRTPAGAATARVVEEVKARGVLVSSDGPDHNVLKVKPPLALAASDVDRFVEVLDEVLTVVGR